MIMSTDIVGSRLHSQVGYGDTSSQQASSFRPGDPPIKRSDIARSIIGADGSVSANPVAPTIAGIDSSQTRTIDASPIAKNSGICNAPTATLPGAGASPRPSFVAKGASVHTNTMPAKGKTL
jgi:hypothetical protein